MPDYRSEKAELLSFFENYLDPVTHVNTYHKQLEEIANRHARALNFFLDDVPPGELRDAILNNTRRYQKLIADAADEAMPECTVDEIVQDIFDVLAEQRARRQAHATESEGVDAIAAQADPFNDLPAELMRRYEVVIHPPSKQRPIKMREVCARHVGKLVIVRGIVTHVTDVKPLVTVATYLDDSTGFEVYQEVRGKEFKPLMVAPLAIRNVSKPPTLYLQTRGSKFVRFQELKLQELPLEVPQGSTPRTLTVHLRGEITRTCKPGDSVTMSGIFLPEPANRGFSAMRAGLVTQCFLEAMTVTQDKQSYDMVALDDKLRGEIEEISESSDIYDRLAHSLAPEIWGHEDVKKALLLAMVGGVTKHLPDGMKLRGDIHACIMGDPGVAKSQLLKHIAHISPRAVYTTGKGSSGVGLTAAVMRDPVTGEMILEGGALVLADKGICCIDEFDKMDEGDRTAIHEVMEQQTVSIAKAGITTTLNTRTTLLAAANPAWGRYDTRRSPAENIALPAALLSRFDIMWLILDKADPEQDRQLANHVLAVHKDGRAPPLESGITPLEPRVLRGYIAIAKQHEPVVPEDLTEYIASVYAEMRKEEAEAHMPHSYTTARTLLSILRLAQALARLRFADRVSQPEVDEALRLMRMSKHSLLEEGSSGRAMDPISAVYCALRDDAQRNNKYSYTWSDLVALLGRDHTNEQIREAVKEYGEYNVFSLEYPRENEPTVHLGHDDLAAH